MNDKYKFDPRALYYSKGGIEVIDIIKAKLTPEQYKGYLLGNVLKYACRLNFKGCVERDVEKLANYSKWLAAQNIPITPKQSEYKDMDYITNMCKSKHHG